MKKTVISILSLLASVIWLVIIVTGGYAMNLKKIRNEKSLSIRALSELADVPKRTIEDIERFDRCKVDTAIMLADALQVTLDELCRNTPDTE